MSSRKRSDPGFTLLELSVVLFIMAVLLGISLPSFSNFFESDLKKEASHIAGIIDELKLQAVLDGENYKLVFDTNKSELSIYTLYPADHNYLPHSKYGKPISLTPPVEFEKISVDVESAVPSKFGVPKLEFDKIFGQQYEFRIDSSGFVDLFAVKLKDNKNSLTITVRNIMGDITIGREIPL